MYRQFEDMEEIGRLDDERLRLLVENRELKKKMERKKYKTEALKEEVERLTKALAQAQDGQYEKEQQELRRAELQNFQLAPFIDLPKEEESSIPFDDIGERIIVRDGKTYKQWFELGFGTDILYREEEKKRGSSFHEGPVGCARAVQAPLITQ